MELSGNVAVLVKSGTEENVAEHVKKQYAQAQIVSVGTSVIESFKAKNIAPESLDVLVTFNDNVEKLSSELTESIQFIKAGGKHLVYVSYLKEEDKNAVLMAMMIGGLLETKQVESIEALKNYTAFVSQKPSFQAGSSAPLNLKSQGQQQTLKKWTLTADDDEDDEFIDEDTLLDDTDEVLKAAKDDCGVGKDGKRRACKDCTCGRKDMEDRPVVSDSELSQMVSSCGNCFKGDAFRCGSCPFLGKPAFKPGMENVMLNLDDADDI